MDTPEVPSRGIAEIAAAFGQNHPVIEPPETRHAKASDGRSVCYQVTGDGPIDVVELRAHSDP